MNFKKTVFSIQEHLFISNIKWNTYGKNDMYTVVTTVTDYTVVMTTESYVVYMYTLPCYNQWYGSAEWLYSMATQPI